MKKFTLIIAACFLSLGLFAQQADIHKVASFPSKLNLSADKAIDTLMAPVFYTALTCADTITYFSVGTGYLTGNGTISGYAMNECSQAFDNTISGNVVGAVGIINLIAGTTGTFTSKVYSVDATQKPTTALATSNTVDISTMTLATANEVAFTYATPPAVTGNFAVSVVYPTVAGDTIAVFQTNESCVDAAKDQYAYCNLTTLSWYAYKTIMSMNSMGSFDLFLFAVVSSTTDIQENPLAASLNIYPNPASDNATIVCLNHMQNVRVMNCLGQTVQDNVTDGLLFNLNTSQLDNGVYLVEILTDNGVITKKITVNK